MILGYKAYIFIPRTYHNLMSDLWDDKIKLKGVLL